MTSDLVVWASGIPTRLGLSYVTSAVKDIECAAAKRAHEAFNISMAFGSRVPLLSGATVATLFRAASVREAGAGFCALVGVIVERLSRNIGAASLSRIFMALLRGYF